MNRSIDSSIWKDEDFCASPPLLRILQLGIMTTVNDAGVMLAKSAMIRNAFFAEDEISTSFVDYMLEELEKRQVIELFEQDNRRYLRLTKKLVGQRVGGLNKEDYGVNWKRLSGEAKQRDGNKCVNCGKTNCRLAAHHIEELGSGGKNELDNLVTLCSSCHRKAHKKTTDK